MTETDALDTWLAEHLFDLAIHEWEPQGHLSPFNPIARCTVEHEGHCYPSNMPDFATKYSTTGNGMLLVLEAIRGYSLRLYPPSDYATRATADWSNGDGWNSVHADTLPLAVAQAARAALEVQCK